LRKSKGRLQLLCAIDELGVAAFVCLDEMGDAVDDNEALFNW
jgi:hypothetical protein